MATKFNREYKFFYKINKKIFGEKIYFFKEAINILY